MSIKSYPFKAMNTGTVSDPVWDRAMSSGDDASRFDVFSNGVCGVDDWKAVKTAGTMKVSVGAGKIRIDGREGVIYTSPESLTLDAAGSLARIDVVAAEKNLTDPVRAIRLVVVKGSEAASPVAPALTDTDNIRQVGLATVRVPPGVSNLDSAVLTDIRPMAGLKIETEHYNAAGFLLLAGYLEKIVQVSGSVLPLAQGSLFTKTITEATSFSFSSDGISAGYAYSALLVLKMTSNVSVTFPASVRWAGGMPVLKNGYTYEFVFRTYDGGSSWIASGTGGILNA